VSPPSFGAKTDELKTLLSDIYGLTTVRFGVSQQDIQNNLVDLTNTAPVFGNNGGEEENAMERETIFRHWQEQKLKPGFALAKFALLRWDELDELAYRLSTALGAPSSEPKAISPEILQEALKDVADSQWRKNKSYFDYSRDTQSERRDYQMLNVWEVKGRLEMSVPGVVPANGSKWLARSADSLKDIKIPDFELISVPPGGVEIRALAPK
jgi:hypothetical protein